jgi:hypothetical protein
LPGRRNKGGQAFRRALKGRAEATTKGADKSHWRLERLKK